jgi:outer membrane lipoprotein-sorting protein
VEEGEMSSYRRDLAIRVSLLILTPLIASSAQNSPSAPPLTTNEIVQKLMAANTRRSEALRGYSGKRNYHVDYTGWFGHRTADLQVQVTYTAPDKKEFREISRSGSNLLVNRILMRLLRSESEAQESQNRHELEVTTNNYNFALEDFQHTPAGDFYVLKVTPKGQSRYLYRGKIWVDAHDFAITRMEGEPQRTPSMWASHTEVAYRWLQQNGFWLPQHTESASQVRMGGKVTLTIDYSDYQISTGTRLANDGQRDTLPSPTTVTADPP